jgi:two-component system cell cycle sensor histidine kinase/response regulator CckA
MSDDSQDPDEPGLVESERRYRQLVERAADAICQVDLDGRFLYANPMLTRLLGYPESEILGRHYLDVVVPDQRREVRAFYARQVADRLPSTYLEFAVVTRTGEEVWLGQNVQLLHTPNGYVLQSVARDITEKRRSEDQVRREQEKFRMLAEAAFEGLIVHQQGRILEVNPALCAMVGYEQQELVGCSVLDLVDPSSHPVIHERIAHPTDAPTLIFARRRDGTRFTVEVVARTMPYRDGKARITAVRDVTQRVETERALRRQALIFDNLHDALVITDLEDVVLDWNRAAERMFGYTRDEVVGKVGSRLLKLRPVGTMSEQPLATMQREGRFVGPVHFQRKDGGDGTSDLALIPLPDESGRVVETAWVHSDATESARLEAQLRQSQKMEAVGRLAGGVAHDFNNLLTVISGYSELLLLHAGGNADLKKTAEIIQNAAERAAAVTGQLLAFSRKQVLVAKVLDMGAVVAGVESLLRRMIGEDIQLLTARAAGLWKTRADPAQMEQVLVNLAVNARDAMPRGGTLRMESANVFLDDDFVRAHPGARVGPHVMVAVSDTGVGMDAATQSHLFEPFFTTKPQGKGTGLGLATVYGIVKQSLGFVGAESEPGRGTTFRIYLPRHEAAHAASQDERPAPPVDLGAGDETILLVEDDDMLRGLALVMLKNAGYDVLEARHAGEALVIAERHPGRIHLLLTDVVMPHMSGPELADRIVAARADTRVLFVSGYTDDAVLRNGVEESKKAFLAKPFSASALTRKIREVLDAPADPTAAV